jgi:hypothetical protein
MAAAIMAFHGASVSSNKWAWVIATVMFRTEESSTNW